MSKQNEPAFPSWEVWECKIVVPYGAKLPYGFDAVPRIAAINAIEKHKIPIIACFSGWGGTLTKSQTSVLKEYAERAK
jgi:hypothetical protein